MNAAGELLRCSCLCAGIGFTVRAPVLSIGNCHCSMCRRQHGNAFSTYAQVSADAVTVIRGAELIVTFASSDHAQRQFCACCGSKLFWRTQRAPRYLWIAAGTFDDDPGMVASFHMFTDNAASWHEICDALPRHAASLAHDAL